MRPAATTGAEPARLPSGAELRRAAERIAGLVRRTPLQRSLWLSELAGAEVYLKLECWQATHSFKLRGAANAVAALSPEVRGRGVVTASAGNHGLALAYAARVHGVRATVFVPRGAPATKKRRIRRNGAELREVDGGYDDAAAAARSFADRAGSHLVHAFIDPAVVAGQGTVGLEILEALPEVRQIVVPVGGGGLLAGIGAAAGAASGSSDGDRGARMVGVQSVATRAMHAAFEAGGVVPVVDEPTLCDGLAGETETPAYERARRVTDRIVLVEESAIAPAIRSLYAEEGIVAEGSGAVGVAALLERAVDGDDPIAVVVSGGNIDAPTLARILDDD